MDEFEVTPENMSAALAARIDCPVCDGKVRLTLGSEGPGDVAIWACNACNSEWYENGKPRWSIELVMDVEIQRYQATADVDGRDQT